MNIPLRFTHLLLLFLLLPLSQVSAGDMASDIAELQSEWARIKYQSSPKEQKQQFEALAEKAATVTARYPQRAEPLVWEGIILSTLAGSKGGLGALSLVKASRDRLEQALAIDPLALDGSAYTSLGTLYYKVPGWPIGFGDSDKAEALLKKALDINPDGIDPNFFYGEFLYEEGRYPESISVLNHALEAPARPSRPLADAGRKGEIELLLAEARKHID
jgi:tetratricopeptide (TPR) repeat protein